MTNEINARIVEHAFASSFGLRISFELPVSSFGFPNRELTMTAGIIGRRPRTNAASQRKRPTATDAQPTAPIQLPRATAVGAVLTVTFDQSVSLNGTPAYRTDVVGATALSAVMTEKNPIAVTFSAPV